MLYRWALYLHKMLQRNTTEHAEMLYTFCPLDSVLAHTVNLPCISKINSLQLCQSVMPYSWAFSVINSFQ